MVSELASVLVTSDFASCRCGIELEFELRESMVTVGVGHGGSRVDVSRESW